MKLHTNEGDKLIFSTDDILSSGKNIGKVLTEIIDNHTTDINDLKSYTKWLYKYGAVGSASSSGNSSGNSDGSSSILSYQIKLAGIIIQNINDSIILGDNITNDKNVPLEIVLSNPNVNNQYIIKDLIVNGITQSISSRNTFTIDNDFKQSYSLNLSSYNKGNISFILRYTTSSGSVMQTSISIKYIKEAYSFNIDIVNNDNNSLFINNEHIFYTNSVNNTSGVNLKISYDLQTEDDVIVRTDSDLLSENEFIINSVDKKEGNSIISFNNNFISLDAEYVIGDYLIPLSFYSNGTRIYQTSIDFTIVPNNDVFIKIKPSISNAQIYKYYSENNEDIINEYNIFNKYYTLYEKLNINHSLDSNEISDVMNHFNIELDTESIALYEDLQNELYDNLTNYKYYVFSTGNLGFIVSPYMPQNISETTLYYKIAKLTSIESNISSLSFNIIDMGHILATQKNKSLSINIVDEGIYVLSIYTADTKNIIYYYFYAYNKDNTFNWYRSNIESTFNKNKNLLNYYRFGHTTSYFDQYQNSQYIQQYASNSDKTICNIETSFNSNDIYDCFVSIGIQYSYINNGHSYKNGSPIISIDSNDNAHSLKVNIYQDKIIINDNELTLFLPKETSYSVSNSSNYHLISLYKRYLYHNGSTPYYEICVYLDGTIEGAMQAFSNSSAIWNSIILHSGNYSVNLVEISYLAHSNDYYEDDSGNITYLDDIAISEYHYKYANECRSSANVIDEASQIINVLRRFNETDYGMIKVGEDDKGSDGSNIIKEISKVLSTPILVFEYSEDKDGLKPKFVNNFFPPAGQEGRKFNWTLDGIYYGSGKTELDIFNINNRIIIDDGNGYWYIELQGSSTMQYFVKNLTLGIKSNTSGYIYLFTPNFIYAEDSANTTILNDVKKSFLPEQAFTLKADMVDSSHCNNTSIGSFVNNNTKKFEINFNKHSQYHKYIKNCLTGFPVLTFIKVNSYDSDGNAISNIYFLGIYNFNLGRDSYFNMGYYDPLLLEENNDGYINEILKKCDGNTFATMKFQLTNADDTELKTREEVIVAEIQGNSSYNDFSQYGKTILAPDSNNDKDDAAMFGDFVPALTVNTQNKTLWHLQRLMEHVSKGGGYIFDYILKKHLGMHSYEYSKYIDAGENSSIFNSANQVPTYRLQFKRNSLASDNLKYLIDFNSTSNKLEDHNKIINLLTDTSTANSLHNYLINLIFNTDDVNETQHDGIKEAVIDYPSLSEYYTICMAFGLTDSVMKNLNVKTWNASWQESYMTSSELHNVTGKWYVAFYDMDTAFGRYNNGTFMDNSYFSFSDYWLSSDENELSEITIYRDFYPKENKNDQNVSDQTLKIHGYDSPSSYLFAVAKYAAIAIENSGVLFPDGTALDEYNENDKFKMYVPQNIWTKFRALPSSVTSESSYYGLNGIGELRNAKYFVDTYFSKEMNNIPEQLWNMNYRFKYLKRIKSDSSNTYGYSQTTEQNSGFSAKEIQSFHGRGIYQVEDWLNFRLHMLDAYFNVDQTSTPIKYLVYEPNYEIIDCLDDNGTLIGYSWNDLSTIITNENEMPRWEATGYYDITPVDSYTLLQNNEDVVILKDVFSQNEQGNRYISVNLNVKALEYSPLIIIPYSRTNQKKYLLINPNKYYNINIQQTSSDIITFGGSGLWTDIQNANSLIASSTLSIFSDKIENLIVTSGICGTWNIGNMKSLNKISIIKNANDITSRFSGTISIDSSEEDKHPDLTTIILDRTNISLSINKGAVQTIQYLRSTGNLSLIDCNNLNSLTLTASNIQDCKILPGWTNNISISNVNIKNLIISAKDINANNNTLLISNISTLESLTINGNFKSIEINNCILLKDIVIENPESVESLSIINCNNENTTDDSIMPLNIYVTKNNDQCTYEDENGEIVIDLNSLINLKAISFNSTFGFNIIDISKLAGYTLDEYDGTKYESYKFIKLLSAAFENTKLYKIVSSNLYLMISSDEQYETTKTSTFSNSYIGQINGSVKHLIENNFFIPKSVSNISGLFSNSSYYKRTGGITKTIAGILLGNILVNSDNYCTCTYEDKNSITNMSNMFYGQDITCSSHDDNIMLTLSTFKNCQNISNIFLSCKFSYISKVLFELNDSSLGENITYINIDDFCSISKFELNAFDPIINKIQNFYFYLAYCNIISIYDDNAQLLTNDIFNAKDLFGNISSSNIINHINNVNFSNDLNINWEGLLINEDGNSRFPNLSNISYSFNHENKNDIGFNNIGFEKIIDLDKTDITIYSSFNLYNKNEPVDYEIFHKLNLKFNTILINDSSLNMYKTCTNDDLIKYIEDYNNAQIKTLNYVFSKLVLKVDESDYHILELDSKLNTYVFTQMKYAFSSLSCTNNVPLIIDKNTLRSFTNVIYWDYAFSNILLYKNLPLNMFNLRNSIASSYYPSDYSQKIISMQYMFSNIKITKETWFAHENYEDLSIEDYNSPLEGSYKYKIYTYVNNEYLYNPKCVDIENTSDFSSYGKHIINHLILPFDVFYGCTAQCNIEGCFANSQFEGIMPDRIFKNTAINNYDNASFKYTFKNLLVIPNKVYNKNTSFNIDTNKDKFKFNILDENGSTLGLYDNINNTFVKLSTIDYTDPDINNINLYMTGKYMYVYSFIPSEFTNIVDLNNAFNFKILLPNSPDINNEDSDQEAYSIFMYDSIGTYNEENFSNRIGLITNLISALPGSNITLHNVIEEINGTFTTFDPTKYYNILYFIMLPDTSQLVKKITNTDTYEISNYNQETYFGLDRIHLGFEYINSIKLKTTFMKNASSLFNSNLSMFLYGAYINVSSDNNFINFNCNMLDAENDVTTYTSIISLNSAIYYYYYDPNIIYNNYETLIIGSINLSKFALLPNITVDENRKYAINFENGTAINKVTITSLNTNTYNEYKELYDKYIN